MRSFFGYIGYILRHKALVYRMGLDMGLSRGRLLAHDLSRLSWTELREGVRYFNHQFGSSQASAEKDKGWSRSWLHHFHRNPHHWQYWIYCSCGSLGRKADPLQMPMECVFEMVVDWLAALTARLHLSYRRIVKKDLWEDIIKLEEAWWWENKDDILKMMHPHTGMVVEEIMSDLKYESRWQYLYEGLHDSPSYSPLSRLCKRNIQKYVYMSQYGKKQ